MANTKSSRIGAGAGARGVCLAAVALGCALTLAPATAIARDLPEGGLTAQDVADWLRASGYSPTIKPQPSTANGQIVSSTVEGVNFDIYFYGCDGQRCRDIQYAAGWSGSTITVDKVNDWNRDNRYIRAYIGSTGLFGEYDVDVAPGGTWEMLDHSLSRWRTSIGDFKKFVAP